MQIEQNVAKEERWNAITHGVGLLFALISLPFLLFDGFERWQMAHWPGLASFGLGMIMVYAFSTLYHAAVHPETKAWLKKADHISIYFLIAGTYTPLMLRYLPEETTLWFLPTLWAMVLAGSIFKWFFAGRFEFVSVMLYLTMGWMVLLVIRPLLDQMPWSVFSWILAGGISYSAGVFFYVKSHKKYHHAIWHGFVLAGTIAHFISIYKSL